MTIESDFEDPSWSRISVLDQRGETRIIIPAPRTWFVILFLIFWLGGWSVGGFSAWAKFQAGSGEGKTFLGFWLCAWLLGELFALWTLLWMCLGREIVAATQTSVSRTYSLLLFSRTRYFKSSSISDLRWQKGEAFPSESGQQSCISFEYGPRTISFAKGHDAGVAAKIISTLEKNAGLSLMHRARMSGAR
ncbi:MULTISPECIES: hypothetical protein [Mesorhizobium]|nr:MULTISPECIES: hypothetical protein [Mesorhizobium]